MSNYNKKNITPELKEITDFKNLVVGKQYIIGKQKDTNDITFYLAGNDDTDYLPTSEEFVRVEYDNIYVFTHKNPRNQKEIFKKYNMNELINNNDGKINIWELPIPDDLTKLVGDYL